MFPDREGNISIKEIKIPFHEDNISYFLLNELLELIAEQ
jgi:hypothetical protein